MNKRYFIISAAIIILLSMTWIILTPVLFPGAQADGNISAPHKGFFAPDFMLQTPANASIGLSDYSDQPILIFFWASWCSVCKATMPQLQTIYNQYAAQGFEVLAVNTTYQDNLSDALKYFQSKNLTFPLLLDQDGSASSAYQLHALPTAVLIGPDGIILDVIIGSGISEGYLQSRLDNILTGKE